MDFRYQEHTNNKLRGFFPASNHAENSRSNGGANTERFAPPEDESSSQLALASSHIQKEHMFDKVVTPSDVGKLNRLVIPKQHAEKYFPLDSSANEKGLLLNFEDRTGKPWRFRYSYWNSSQSYVMTKGWSRFVKEKKLDAGDIVSFQRGLGELGKDRLFIDWRRRVLVNTLPPATFPHGFHENAAGGYQRAAVPWSPMYMRPPQHLVTQSAAAVQYFPVQAQYYPNQVRNTHNHNNYQYYNNNAVSPPFIYLKTSESEPGAVVTSMPQQAMVYESVPVMVHGKNVASAKKLRLFGVNMECGVSSESNNVDAMEVSQSSSPSTIPFSTLQQSRLYNGIPITQTDFLNKDKSSSSSMSLDFDI